MEDGTCSAKGCYRAEASSPVFVVAVGSVDVGKALWKSDFLPFPVDTEKSLFGAFHFFGSQSSSSSSSSSSPSFQQQEEEQQQQQQRGLHHRLLRQSWSMTLCRMMMKEDRRRRGGCRCLPMRRRCR